MKEKDNSEEDHEPKSGNANRHHISTTDPDASVTRQGAGKPKLQYKTQRSVDRKAEIITAAEVTPGEVNEAHLLSTLLAMHQDNTQATADTVVADAKYGTVDNYLACCNLGLNAHIPDLKRTQQERDKRRGIFTEDAFQYNPETDAYLCPAGQHLKKKNYNPKRDAFEYKYSALFAALIKKSSSRCAGIYVPHQKGYKKSDLGNRPFNIYIPICDDSIYQQIQISA